MNLFLREVFQGELESNSFVMAHFNRSPSVLTQSPEDIPPIDPRAVLDLEINARRVAENLDFMMSNMKGSLNKVRGVVSARFPKYNMYIPYQSPLWRDVITDLTRIHLF